MPSSKWKRRLLRILLVLGILLISDVAIEGTLNFIGSRKDAKARAVADINTDHYLRNFALGSTRSQVEASMQLLQIAPVLHRGEDLMIIAQEGRGVWYCSHNYFGTALRFKSERLVSVSTDEWLDTCL